MAATVKATGGELRLIGSPWSAPAWIKDSQAWGHGTIKDDLYPWYAKYLVKVAQTFQDWGLPLYGMTLQNEPRFEPGSYPGTRLSPANESNLANLLHPALKAAGLNVLVVAYDRKNTDTHTPTPPHTLRHSRPHILSSVRADLISSRLVFALEITGILCSIRWM